MFDSLALATGMVTITVGVHYGGIVGLLALLRNRPRRRTKNPLLGQGAAILFIVLSLMVLHAIEIWLYAGLYLAAGAVADLETALYFSTVTFTTVGYGDIVLEPGWRLVGAIESANGLLLFGWSTAFLTTAIGQLSTLDHDWIQGTGEARRS
jgi:voltage-gated potassium channel Kch